MSETIDIPKDFSLENRGNFHDELNDCGKYTQETIEKIISNFTSKEFDKIDIDFIKNIIRFPNGFNKEYEFVYFILNLIYDYIQNKMTPIQKKQIFEYIFAIFA